MWWLFWLIGCPAEKVANPCADNNGEAALSTCLQPTQPASYYEEQALLYFDTLESDADPELAPNYAEGVARWEWPPWLKLTGYGREDMEMADAIIRLIPTSVPERECLSFEVQPFARCRVNFRYEDEGDRPCPIYEEFTFDDAGEMTFIEAWSDNPAYLPMADLSDRWGEGSDVNRLSTRIPGLGSPLGEIDLDSAAMTAAAAADPDVADFVTRARDFYGTWLAEFEASGDTFARGCGW